MIISNSAKYIFVHITKTAGTSVTVTLNDSLKWNDLVLGGTRFGEKIQSHYKNHFNIHKHSSASEIRKALGEDIWSEYFTFTFVRNPYRRTLSLYTWIERMVNEHALEWHLRHLPIACIKKRKLWEWPITHAFKQTKNFSEFIRNPDFLRDSGSKPQISWIRDDNSECIVDFIGKVESIEVDLLHITKRIGAGFNNIKKRNISKRTRPLEAYYSGEEDFEYLYYLYEDDFNYFEYDSTLRF